MLKTVHAGVSLSQREDFVNNGGVSPFGAISLVAAVEVSPGDPRHPPPEGHVVTNASSNDTEATKLTQGTFERLTAELKDLTTRGRVEIAEQIETARALGDLKENGDYHAAKDSQGKMEARIRQLQALLKEVQLVDESDVGDGSVSTGTTVTLRYEGDDEDDTQQFFVGSIEERQGTLPVLSPSAPLGQVLMGKKAGDTVEYTAPGGMLRVEIVAVDH
ncbi:MAG TPA: transcription elongation factor GreA [Acidimicrobiales bacterium]